ncbi:MAG: hypothetical protein M1495_17380 [Bacteroidetes bacterium]|nr:hypothetical protein [Bacteroidota bacterium]
MIKIKSKIMINASASVRLSDSIELVEISREVSVEPSKMFHNIKCQMTIDQ